MAKQRLRAAVRSNKDRRSSRQLFRSNAVHGQNDVKAGVTARKPPASNAMTISGIERQDRMHQVLRNKIALLEKCIEKLEQRNNDLEAKIAHRDYLQTLGVSADEASGGITAPLRIYLKDEKGKTVAEKVLSSIADSDETEIVAWGNGVRGSWLRFAFIKLFGGDADRYRMSLEKAAELKTLGKPQAEVDKLNAETMALCIQALAETSEGVVQNGCVLVAKFRDPASGETRIASTVLTTEQLIYLEKNRSLVQNPGVIMQELDRIGTRSKELKAVN